MKEKILIRGAEAVIIQKGKEDGQGVGYLNDGTMIVVECGQNLVGKEILDVGAGSRNFATGAERFGAKVYSLEPLYGVNLISKP